MINQAVLLKWTGGGGGGVASASAGACGACRHVGEDVTRWQVARAVEGMASPEASNEDDGEAMPMMGMMPGMMMMQNMMQGGAESRHDHCAGFEVNVPACPFS